VASGILVILISSIIAVAVMLSLPSPEPIRFRWGVDIGDDFYFDIEVEGSMNNESNPVPFMTFSSTRIHVVITTLPNISSLDSEEGLVEVVSSQKVLCTLANGTEFADDHSEGFYSSSSTTISEMISRAILPVGGWSFIDDLFPDDLASDVAHGADSNTFYSWIDQESFFFGYRNWYIDFGHGWDACLDKDTGVPISIHHWESDMICIGHYKVTLTLALPIFCLLLIGACLANAYMAWTHE